MAIGKSITRVDAYEKVTGRAKYTDDLCPKNALIAKILRSTIANGWVTSIDTTEAVKLEGVVKIVTCFDVPSHTFPTPGHPWSTDKTHQDIADRNLLNRRVRIYGDEIAAVIAENEIIANRALRLIKVTYEELPAITNTEIAMQEGSPAIHEECPNNILKHTSFEIGNYDEAMQEQGLVLLEKEYESQVVQHCHIEPPISYAYGESDRITVVSSTQIPHIVRRVVGQALGIPWGKIRVIKPYIGGGFGNKQEVLYEPLNAYLCSQVGGRCVKLEISREETFFATRTRHSIKFKLKTAIRPDGRLVARKIEAVSNQGGYASHGHAIVANAVNAYRHLYQDAGALKSDAYTVYTNLPSAGAMRGYGIPQIAFACESHMDDLANILKIDPIELRRKNAMPLGYKDPLTGITCYSSGLQECIEKGKAYIDWDNKHKLYKNQSGPIRRGVGMAIFSYKTGVYPISLETACSRLILNQDGSCQLQMGATEIGQGADTVFTQMAAETIGFSEDRIHIVSSQDTDVTPFDTAAYASRQSYVSGMAVKETATLFKEKILDYAEYMLKLDHTTLDIKDNAIIDKATGEVLLPMENLAIEAFYSLEHCTHITAERSIQCKDNTFSFGACFVEVEVDMPLGKVKVMDIINVHDSGVILNPQLAEAQVHGGMSMGLGYGLSEQLLFDEKAKPLNGNLLDYKLPTSMDTPDLHVDFAATVDPSAPYGNKSLGEPPAIPVAPAVRNAVLNATGVAVNTIPLNPQKMVEKFKESGLI
ncbi:MAG: xanthine dehydrogenase subunit XdhA [Cellulosilyticaceae bacterium]